MISYNYDFILYNDVFRFDIKPLNIIFGGNYIHVDYCLYNESEVEQMNSIHPNDKFFFQSNDYIVVETNLSHYIKDSSVIWGKSIWEKYMVSLHIDFKSEMISTKKILNRQKIINKILDNDINI